MGTDVRRHTAPLAGETPRRQAFNDLSLSINDIVYTANATDTATAIVAIAPTTSRPVYIHQTDTNVLYLCNGATQIQVAPQEVRRATGSSGSSSSSFTTLTSFTLAAGSWKIEGWVDFNVAEGSAMYKGIQIYNVTAASSIVAANDGPMGSVGSFTLLYISDIVTLATPSTIALQTLVQAVSGTQLQQAARLLAARVATPY